MDKEQDIKILVVDDNQNNLIAMEAVFSGTQYKLIEATSGIEALAMFDVHDDIALVLLDVQMPEMDGYETASRMKARPDCAEVPIIFITAYYREDPFVKKGYASGAVDYFGKPFDPDLLKMKVDIYASFRQKTFLLKEREKRVKETEELLRAGRKLAGTFEKLTVGILISDRDGKIFQCNDFASRLFNADEAEGTDHYGEILNWWDKNGAIIKEEDGPLKRALAQGVSTHNQTVQVRCLDGAIKSLVVSASPLVESKGRIMGAVIILQDLSETRKIEKDFEQKVSQLISVNIELEQKH